VILGISFDTPDDNRAFAEAQSFPYPLLSDVDTTIGQAYGTKRDPGEPWADIAPKRVSFLINPQGVVVRRYEVDDVTGHPAQVLADLVAARG
jgi:peroxiredoxin Q/BCP